MGRHKGYKLTEEQKQKIRESCRECPVVHHINGNHFDNRPENRMVVTPREHAIIHSLQGDLHTFDKGYWIDKKHSSETKDKMRKSHLGKKFTEQHKKNISITKLKINAEKRNRR